MQEVMTALMTQRSKIHTNYWSGQCSHSNAKYST